MILICLIQTVPSLGWLVFSILRCYHSVDAEFQILNLLPSLFKLYPILKTKPRALPAKNSTAGPHSKPKSWILIFFSRQVILGALLMHLQLKLVHMDILHNQSRNNPPTNNPRERKEAFSGSYLRKWLSPTVHRWEGIKSKVQKCRKYYTIA